MKIDVGALDMVGDIVGGGGDLEKKRMRSNASARRVKFDTSTKEFVCQASGRCGAGILTGVLEEEKRRRVFQFSQGCDRYPFDRSKMEPPFRVDPEVEEGAAANDSTTAANAQQEKPAKKNGFPGTKKCFLERRWDMGLANDEFHYVLYDEDDGKMLLSASSTDTSGTYYFSSNDTDFAKYGESYVAYMKSSTAGTQFHLFDDGISKSEGGGLFPALERKQRALLIYKTNILGKVPNAMNVVIPRPGFKNEYKDEEAMGEGGEEQQGKDLRSSMYSAFSKSSNKEQFVVLETRKPKWNNKMDAWTMDFKGRVKLASKKNFILIDPQYDDRVLMLFGKVSQDKWSLDYAPPMNPLTCLFVALTAFSSKLAVT